LPSARSAIFESQAVQEIAKMIARKMRSARGASNQEAIAVAALIGILYYGYQYISLYKAPTTQLLNKDFVCGDGAFKGRRLPYSHCVFASQNPKLLVEYIRKSNLQARLQAPDKAIENENERYRIESTHAFVNLGLIGHGESMADSYNPLVVHVLGTDYSEKDVPLLLVRPLNKCHKGESWYISATSINPAANVTGFADVAAKTHKYGVMDVLENKDAQKSVKSVLNSPQMQKQMQEYNAKYNKQ